MRIRKPGRRCWEAMMDRCYNQRSARYPRYGGRGIVVCERWKKSFAAFMEDMGPRPSLMYSLDRIDNDKNYEPGNVRWATMLVQQNNKPNNVLIEAFGRTQTLGQWAREFDVPYARIRSRIVRGLAGADLFRPPVWRRVQ